MPKAAEEQSEVSEAGECELGPGEVGLRGWLGAGPCSLVRDFRLC